MGIMAADGGVPAGAGAFRLEPAQPVRTLAADVGGALHHHGRSVAGGERGAEAALSAAEDGWAGDGGADQGVRFRPFSAEVHTIRSEEHTSELQSLMRISYAVFCLKKKNKKQT